MGAGFVIIGFVIMTLFESETIGPKMTNKYLMKKLCKRNYNSIIGEEYDEELSSGIEKELIKE